MKKLVNGILDFRRKLKPAYRDTFAKLALGQKPDALFISCSDSRVAVNVFASTDPGDLFVNRNVGNMVPPCRHHSEEQDGVAAVIEFAVKTLNVRNIILCGHSECGAMFALINGVDKIQTPGLKKWLGLGEDVLPQLKSNSTFATSLAPHNRLSQLNVLKQLEHLKSYPFVQDGIQSKSLRIHGWWFEISKAEVYSFDEAANRFLLIDETQGARIMENL